VPWPDEADHGMVLEAEQLRTLVNGFKNSVLFPIVATLAFTGCRRNEALALRWSDLEVANKTLRIERALEETGELGLSFKGPKTQRGKCTITIDDDLIVLLVAEREKYLRPRHRIQVNGYLSWRISSRNFGSQPARFRRVLTLPWLLLARTRPRAKRRTVAMFLAPCPVR